MNATNDKSIGRIIIAGSGVDAWLTAASLLKQLGKTNTHIMVCPVDGSDGLDSLYSLMPDFDDDVLRALGVSNLDLVKKCRASFSMGTRYKGLSVSDFDQIRPYGNIGINFPGGPFVHHWLRNSRNTGTSSSAADYFSYSTAYPAIRRNAFAPPVKRTAIGPLQHQMVRHVDVGLLTNLLRSIALSNGATESVGGFKSVERAKGSTRIEQLLTTSGEVLQADLYIDCSGKGRCLTNGPDAAEWVSTPLSSVYELRFTSESDNSAPPPFNCVSALGTGWQITTPGYGWQLTTDLVADSKLSNGHILKPGYISRPWSENCVALGLAATEILPVEALQTKSLMTGLKRLVKLLPGSDCATRETIEFNQLFVQDSQEVAELSALYELARGQAGIEPSSLATLEMPDNLRNRLALFIKRGWVAPLDTDLISPADWTAVLIMLGLFPLQYDRIVDRVPADKLKISLRDLKARIEKVSAEFPPLGAYLSAVKSSPESKSSNE